MKRLIFVCALFLSGCNNPYTFEQNRESILKNGMTIDAYEELMTRPGRPGSFSIKTQKRFIKGDIWELIVSGEPGCIEHVVYNKKTRMIVDMYKDKIKNKCY